MTRHRLFAIAIAILWMASGTDVRADPRELAGVLYEQVVRGTTAQGEPLPLLVAFHYSGGTARESFEHYDQVAGPVRILVPLGAYPKRQGLSYFPVDYYQRPPDEQFRVARDTVAEMARFLEAAEALYGSRPVVSGISQGGDISLLLAVYHPDTVTAAVPLAAVIPDALVTTPDRAGQATPCILMMQGEDDAIVDVSRTRVRAATLQPGLRLALVTYPALGHDISPAMKADYTTFINDALHNTAPATGTAAACSFR